MAWTDQQLAILDATFDALPSNLKAMFNASSTQDTAAAITEVVARRRSAGMMQIVSATVTTQVSDWDTLESAALVADGATLRESLIAAKAALAAHDPDLGKHAVAAVLAAFKHFGI